jgi:uncharacterized protein
MISAQILLALTFIACTVIVTNTVKMLKFGRGTIQVKGCAEKEIHSDYVKMNGTINSSAVALLDAYLKLEKDRGILQNYLKEQGVSPNEISFRPITTSTVHKLDAKGRSTNNIEHYVLHQTFYISSNNIPLITSVAENITTLLREGLEITSSSPDYLYMNIDILKISMLAEASQDAYQRADALVTKSGAKVGSLITCKQGVFQITDALSTAVSDYGEYDTSSIDKRIKAVVTMEYEIL